MKRRNCKQVLNQKGRSPFGLRPFAAFRVLNKSDAKMQSVMSLRLYLNIKTGILQHHFLLLYS